MNGKKVLIVDENSFVPLDIRVWYEAITLRDTGWQPIVICPSPTGVHAVGTTAFSFGKAVDLEGISVYYFLLNSTEENITGFITEYLTAFLAIARLSWRVWRSGRFDIIHLCNPPDIFFPLGLFYRLLGVRVVFDHHDLFPELIAHRFHGLMGKLLYIAARVTEFLSFRTAHISIATNLSYHQVAMERGWMPENHDIVVRNGPKTSDFTPVESDLTLKQGFDYMVCYAGVMGQEDGVQELIDSIRFIVSDMHRHDILFVLLGDGSIRSKILSKLDDWGVAAFVQSPGMIRDKEILRKYLCTADICVSPEPLTPLNRKSTFIKVAEYMAMSKPIVAFDLEETRCTAQEAALYVEPGNTRAFAQAIVTLLDNPEFRYRMGKLGRQLILDQLSWEHQQENLLRAYELALSGVKTSFSGK